jgi:acyl-CoA thioester hydrolase
VFFLCGLLILSTISAPVQFEYAVRVQPHHTDYAGVVWHGSYVRWMEEARIDALRSVGIEFADLVAMGCDLPVVELSLNYRKPLQMGDVAIVRSYLLSKEKVRWVWSQTIELQGTDTVYVEGKVVLVAMDRQLNRLLRSLPPQLQSACDRFLGVTED